MINIYHWTKDWEHCQLEFYGEPFAACDPGKDGAIVLCAPDGTIEESHALSGASELEIAQGMERIGISTIVMEDQFMGRNSSTVLDLRLGVGILIARIEGWTRSVMGGNCQIDVVFVQPGTWHAVILPTCKGRKELKAGAETVVRVEEEANSEHEVTVPEWTKADMGGFFDAVCIRDWWAHVSEPEEMNDE